MIEELQNVEINNDNINENSVNYDHYIKYSHSIVFTLTRIPSIKYKIKFQFNRLKKYVKSLGGLHYKSEYQRAYNQFLNLEMVIKKYLNHIEILTMELYDAGGFENDQFQKKYDDLFFYSSYLNDLACEIEKINLLKEIKLDDAYGIIVNVLMELSDYFAVDYDTSDMENIKISKVMSKK